MNKKELLKILREQILPEYVFLLDIEKNNFATTADFAEFLNKLIGNAKEKLIKAAGVKGFAHLGDRTLQYLIGVLMVSNFNSVLPLDHQFIVAIRQNEDGSADITCVKRNILKGIHDIINESVVPIYNADTDPKTGEGRMFNIRYIPGDPDLLNP